MIDVFPYEAVAHDRRHGPAGYAAYKSYKDWLRDEFSFRCVYCLFREKWYPKEDTAAFAVEHSVPESRAPELALNYDNLLYSCNRCNSFKTDLEDIVDPCSEAMAKHVAVRSDGMITALTMLGQDLVDALHLNDPQTVANRKEYLAYASELDKGAIEPPAVADLIRELFAFPEDLPDLRNYRPPSNTRPAGVDKTYFIERELGKLPPTY